MDCRAKIIFVPKKTRKPAETIDMRPHEEIEWHVDEGGRPYYISDDLISVDDSDDEVACENPIVSFSDSARPGQTLIDAIEAQEDVDVQYDVSRDLYYMEGAGEMVSIKDIKPDAASVTNQGIFSAGVKLSNQATAEPRSIEQDAKTPNPECKI